MKFEQYLPAERLKDYIKYYVVSENALESAYKVFPSTGLVIGFQYNGYLAALSNHAENKLASAGITGISDGYKVFRNSNGIGTILVFFTETGFTHFTTHPANTLFNLSIALEDIFEQGKIREVEEKLATAATDLQRIKIVEHFFLAQLKEQAADRLVAEAVRRIQLSGGNLRVKALTEKLYISQSPLEKRFRKVVGTTPKKFAAIVRFNAVLKALNAAKPLTEICYENNFFDQPHFIKDFKKFTGDTPENFKRLL